MRNLPFSAFEHNRVWLELSLIAQELLAWIRLLRLEGKLALPNPRDCPSACCRSPAGWFVGPSHHASPTALLAVGRGAGCGLRRLRALPAGTGP